MIQPTDADHFFIFFPTRLTDAWITINGQTMTQSQWICREVTKVILANWIALLDQHTNRLFNPRSIYGLLPLPQEKSICETFLEPLVYSSLTAVRFHQFCDA